MPQRFCRPLRRVRSRGAMSTVTTRLSAPAAAGVGGGSRAAREPLAPFPDVNILTTGTQKQGVVRDPVQHANAAVSAHASR